MSLLSPHNRASHHAPSNKWLSLCTLKSSRFVRPENHIPATPICLSPHAAYHCIMDPVPSHCTREQIQKLWVILDDRIASFSESVSVLHDSGLLWNIGWASLLRGCEGFLLYRECRFQWCGCSHRILLQVTNGMSLSIESARGICNPLLWTGRNWFSNVMS